MKIRKLLAALLAAAMACCFMSIPASAAKKSYAPAKVTVSVGSTTATVKWDKVKGASAYRVQRYDSEKKKYVSYKKVTGTSCRITGLEPSEKYKIKVTAYKKKNGKLIKLSESKAKTVKTAARPESINIAGIMVYDIGQTEVITAKVDPSDFQDVQWSAEDPDIAEITASGNTCTVTALKQGITILTAAADDKTISIPISVSDTVMEKKESGFHVKIYNSKKAEFIFDGISRIKEGSGDWCSATFKNDYSMYHIGLFAFENSEIKCVFGILEETIGGHSDEGAVCFADTASLDYRYENDRLIISCDLDDLDFLQNMEDLKKYIKIDFNKIASFSFAARAGGDYSSAVLTAKEAVIKG